MSDPAGFETTIKPMFRDGDRDAMLMAFDLWDYDDVSEHADSILDRLEDGSMPCDAAWPQDRISAFSSWIEAGKPR